MHICMHANAAWVACPVMPTIAVACRGSSEVDNLFAEGGRSTSLRAHRSSSMRRAGAAPEEGAADVLSVHQEADGCVLACMPDAIAILGSYHCIEANAAASKSNAQLILASGEFLRKPA